MPRDAPPYAPDFVSAETLAHRLDCSKSTVSGYVRRGLLPKPLKIGELVRWRWADVEQFIMDRRTSADGSAAADDPYLAGLRNGSPPEADD